MQHRDCPMEIARFSDNLRRLFFRYLSIRGRRKWTWSHLWASCSGHLFGPSLATFLTRECKDNWCLQGKWKLENCQKAWKFVEICQKVSQFPPLYNWVYCSLLLGSAGQNTYSNGNGPCMALLYHWHWLHRPRPRPFLPPFRPPPSSRNLDGLRQGSE